MKNSQQHLGNEAHVTLCKNINLVPRLLSHFHMILFFDGVTFIRKIFGVF